jgi:hypothetical protein
VSGCGRGDYWYININGLSDMKNPHQRLRDTKGRSAPQQQMAAIHPSMQAQAAGVLSIGVAARLREIPTSFLTQTPVHTLLANAHNEAANQGF